MKTLSKLFVLIMVFTTIICQSSLGTISNLRLRGVTIVQPPYVFYDPTAPNQASQYYGFAIDLYNEALALLGANNTYELYLVPDGNFGVDTGNGTWNGMVGELLNGNADIIVGPLTESFSRYEVIDFTVVYTEIGCRIVVMIPNEQGNPFSFFDPFEAELWVLILFTAIIMGFILWFMDTASPYGYRRTLDPPDNRQLNVAGSLHNSLLTVIGQGGEVGKSWSTKILLLGFFFFALIVTSTYTANLAAFLTTQSLTGVISTVDDINERQASWAAVNNSNVETIFQTTTDPRYRAIKPLMVLYDTFDDCMAALRRGDVEAIIHADVITNYYVTQHPCDTMTSGDIFLKNTYAIPVPINSSLEIPLSEAILQLREQGVIEDLDRKWYYDTAVCPDPTEKANSDTIKVAQMAGLFYLLIIFIGLALMVLLAEHYIFKFRFNNDMMKRLNMFCGLRPEQEETNITELQTSKIH